jgi:hypothetical protein
MKKLMSVVIMAMVCLAVATGVMAAVVQTPGGNPLSPGGFPGGFHGCMGQGYPTEWCVKWNQGQWVPVQVTMPGYWVWKPVWNPPYPVTLYQHKPGYWQITDYRHGVPHTSTCNGPNQTCGFPYPWQMNPMGGAFDPTGMWQP